MAMSQGFQFKQFFIRHDRCAMKVNTDGILLGAIAHIKDCQNILDLGTGSGLVALMLAQRTDDCCHITALELEPNAYQQAVENAQNSAWANRISVLQGDVMQQAFEQKFDLIVSNPPYFADSLAARTTERDLARSISHYSHLNWLAKAKPWLAENGKITLILPIAAAEKLVDQSEQIRLYCVEQWLIFTKSGKLAKRSIVSFSLNKQKREHKELIIYDLDNCYTTEFKRLTQDFYLNF
ncbi:tRNA1(Val) (adenine(37)-N6)-methyltransferase [Mannheimia haemolytica]|uniref:tRNA1(Val) (adenine(37)-N6)-methyltransferase n=1 Tax=Mannheimia haemolytica TaxID=75985 RepID=UPI001567468F|nr:methyltransferase [Mannheimia haemolytica]MDW1150684.1 methyltransferase [Mannheimia haemolytica]MDW1160842.1 methyltransferase [Mannheimia haemolytica]